MPLIPLILSAEQKKDALNVATQRLEDLSGQSNTLTEKFESQKKERKQKFEIREAEVTADIAKKETEAATRKSKVSEGIEEERAAEEKRHSEKASLLGGQKDSLTTQINNALLEIQKLKKPY